MMAGAAADLTGTEPLPEASLEHALITISDGAILLVKERVKRTWTVTFWTGDLNFWVCARTTGLGFVSLLFDR